MNKKRVKPVRLPHGSGSIQRRGATLWVIYPNAKRRVIQENARTLDWDEAFRLLLQRATQTLEERLAELRSIAANAAQANQRHGQAGTGRAGKRGHIGPRFAAAVRDRQADRKGGTRQ